MRDSVLILTTALATGAFLGTLIVGPPPAGAQPTATATVDGVDYPLCAMEDCSDQPGQVGIWTNSDGVQYLELGETVTIRIEP